MKDLVQEAIVIWDIRYCSGTAKDSQLGGGGDIPIFVFTNRDDNRLKRI